MRKKFLRIKRKKENTTMKNHFHNNY